MCDLNWLLREMRLQPSPYKQMMEEKFRSVITEARKWCFISILKTELQGVPARPLSSGT